MKWWYVLFSFQLPQKPSLSTMYKIILNIIHYQNNSNNLYETLPFPACCVRGMQGKQQKKNIFYLRSTLRRAYHWTAFLTIFFRTRHHSYLLCSLTSTYRWSWECSFVTTNGFRTCNAKVFFLCVKGYWTVHIFPYISSNSDFFWCDGKQNKKID